MSSVLFVWVQYLLPQRLLGRIIYRVARSTRPGIKSRLIRWFANRYGVDLAEAERADLESYTSLNDFFTRALRAEARPLCGDEQTIVSPADGQVTEYGAAEAGKLIQAKGMEYSLTELLGEGDSLTVGREFGCFATIYLAPHDYHRVHMPLTGTLRRTRYLPGTRFSVNEITAARIPNLFIRNERVVAWFDTEVGAMAVVLVGALNVSSITTQWLGEIESGSERVWEHESAQQQRYQRGEEIGRFNLGSTVIVLLPSEAVIWNPDLSSHAPLKIGQPLGQLAGASRAAT